MFKMVASVKEFLNDLEISENERCNLKSKRLAKLNRGRKDYIRPNQTSDKVGNIEHYIICECQNNSSEIIWENLQVNSDELDIRYCEGCNNAIYKVDNEYLFNKKNIDNKYIAISIEFIQKIHKKYPIDKYQKLLDKILIMKKQLIDSNGYYYSEPLF